MSLLRWFTPVCAALALGTSAFAQGVQFRAGNLYPTTVVNAPDSPVVLLDRTRARRPNYKVGTVFAPNDVRGSITPDDFLTELRAVIENRGPYAVAKVAIQWAAYDAEGNAVWKHGQIIEVPRSLETGSDYFPGPNWVTPPPEEAVTVTATIAGVIGVDGQQWPPRGAQSPRTSTARTDTSPVEHGPPPSGVGDPVVSQPSHASSGVAVGSSAQERASAPLADTQDPCGCRAASRTEAEAFRRAANNGDPTAALGVGGMFNTGCFEIQDFVQAHAWFNLAAASGEPTARRCRDEVEKKLGTDQVLEAQALARRLRDRTSKGESKE